MREHLLKPLHELTDAEREELRDLNREEKNALLKAVLDRLAPTLAQVYALHDDRVSVVHALPVDMPSGARKLIVDLRPDGRGHVSLHVMGWDS